MKGWNMYRDIHDMKELGFNKSQVARKKQINRETVSKYWDMSPEKYHSLRRDDKNRGSKLDQYHGFISDELQMWDDISASQIHDHLTEKLLKEQAKWIPSPKLVQNYVVKLREELGLPTLRKIRQHEAVEELPYGKQAQVDMGEEKMKDAFGNIVKVYVFAMVLSRSRQKFVYFQLRKFNAEDFVNAHDMAFKYFCGRRPHEIAYDQDRVMAVSENSGDILLTERFEEYRQYAGFSLYLCHARDPQSKGKIERVIQYVKGNFMSCRTFNGIQELNSAGLSWLDRTANGKKHETTKLVPARVFTEEVRHMVKVPELSALPKPPEHVIRIDNTVSYKQNYYRVPKGTYAPGRKARVVPNTATGIVSFFDAQTNELLTEHGIAFGVGHIVGQRSPRKPGGKTGEELRGKVLLNFAGMPDAQSYVELVLEKYHRYTIQQLRIFKRVQEEYHKQELLEALTYCLEHDLYSANEYRDTLMFLTQPKQVLAEKIGELPAKYSSVTAQVRNVSVYGQLTSAQRTGGAV
jgi:transposase